MENGGCAFPHEHHKGCSHCEHGASLRDYFACHVLGSLLVPGNQPSLDKAKESYKWATYMVEARAI